MKYLKYIKSAICVYTLPRSIDFFLFSAILDISTE
jgi:hypothetical protein